MAWGVFYQPEDFKVPLSMALLSDPAFSSDPRTHPHFNAAFDTQRSPVSTPPPKQIPRPKLIHRPSQVRRRASMKALVRHLTSHHNLDRIDELDETDPFGTSYHHDGPYEAIGGTQQPTYTAQTEIVPHTNAHHPKRAFNPRSLHPTYHQSLPQVPSIHGERGLSLDLKPGQILQHNPIYASHISSVTSIPIHLSRQSNAPAIVAHSDHSPSHSPSNFQAPSTHVSPLHPMNDLPNRPSSVPRTSSRHYSGKELPDIHILSPHHDYDDVPYVSPQTTMTIFPPPRHESRLHNLDSSLPFLPSVSWKTQATECPVPSHDAGHESIHSLDSSRVIDSTIMRSSSNVQNKSLEPPRMRHFPKRLVMPAPLQSQPPQPHYKFSLAEYADREDEYLEDRTPEGTDPEGQPVVYNRGPRVLRKKSSTLPAELPIPHHLSILQNDAMPEMGDIPTTTENEAERPKERIRRRRLSKRKNDMTPS